MMGPLIERPLIHRDFQSRYPTLLSMYDQELDQSKTIFNQQVAKAHTPKGPCINKNMPPVAGMLHWTQELRERIAGGMEKLRMINHE